MITALWAAWELGTELDFKDIDNDTDATTYGVRIKDIEEKATKPSDSARWGQSQITLTLEEVAGIVPGAPGVHSHGLGALDDVTITTAMDGEVLTYDSATGEWVNDAAAGGAHDHDADYADLSHTHAALYQPLDADLTTIAALTPTTNNVIQSVAGAWASRTVAQLKTTLALVKGDVGLGNVDNTSDANKPISTATQTALDAKQPLDADLTAIAALAPANDDVIQRKGGAWVNRTMAQLKADLALVLADITAALGFTPVNKAGDSMTGGLAVDAPTGTGLLVNAAGGLTVDFGNTSPGSNLIRMSKYENANAPGVRFLCRRSRGTVVDDVTILQNGDEIGGYIFQGADGTTFRQAAVIDVVVDGNPGVQRHAGQDPVQDHTGRRGCRGRADEHRRRGVREPDRRARPSGWDRGAGGGVGESDPLRRHGGWGSEMPVRRRDHQNDRDGHIGGSHGDDHTDDSDTALPVGGRDGDDHTDDSRCGATAT